MLYKLIRKALVFVIIVLLISVTFPPSIAIIQHEEVIIDISPKDYLFQTIIDIVNNPDIKELLEQHNSDLLNVDINRNIYCKILFRDPRLFFNILFTRPSMMFNYLDKCYNNGIEIINILGEDKALEIMESMEFTDTRVLNELNNIIMNNEELFERITILEKLNDKTYPDLPFGFNPIICAVLYVITFVACLGEAFFFGIINGLLSFSNIV